MEITSVRSRGILVGAVLLGLTGSLQAQSIPVGDDAFADAERVTQNLPASLAWYVPTAAVARVQAGSLTLVANDRERLLRAYFPAVTSGTAIRWS